MGLIKSVAFDTDGVLVDSDPVHFAVFNDVLKHQGFERLKWKTYVDEGFISYDDKKFFSEYLKTYASHHTGRRRPSVPLLVHEKDERTEKRLEKNPPDFFSYVDSVTKHLEKMGVLLFEVTGSTAEETRRYFRNHLAIKRRFKVVISASDGLPSKPNPAPYREGLRRLNNKMQASISPSEVIAVEDSTKGVQAAKRAGMFVVGIENTTRPGKLYKSGADIVVKELSTELFDVLLSLRSPEEFEKPNLLERLAHISCLSDEVNIGTSKTPILLKRNQWSFEKPLETMTSDHEISLLLSVPAV